MPGPRTHGLPSSVGQLDMTSRLHALAALVNEALGLRGTQPVFAIAAAGGQSRPDQWLRGGLNHAVESPPVRPTRAPSPRKQETGSADSAIPVDGAGDGPDDPMDADHVETWQLVQRAQAGDGEAFGVLYDRYVDLVFRFIYYRVNDRALAEDFTSETFLRALRRIGSITYQGRDIGAWFVTIARNIVLDHVKSARNRLETTTADTIETREYERSTETAVLESLQSERLLQAVNQLGDEQRECIMLRFIQGLSVSETAAVMGKNDGAIKALQHRAVRKLADLVGGELR